MKIIYVNCRVKNYVEEDHRSYIRNYHTRPKNHANDFEKVYRSDHCLKFYKRAQTK